MSKSTSPHSPAIANILLSSRHAEPYAYYQWLRQSRPVHWDADIACWVVTSHAGVREALTHSALAVRPADEPVPRALLARPLADVFAGLARMSDGLAHAERKADLEQLAQQFSTFKVRAAAADTFAALQPVTDANSLLFALPVQVMARLLGVPHVALSQVTQSVQHFARGIAPGASDASCRIAADAAAQLMAWGEECGLSRAATVTRIGLMQQSMDATAGLLGNTLCLLRQRPEIAQYFDGHEDQARAVVREVSRWDAPIHNTRRYAQQAIELQGHRILEGQCLVLVLASANRDDTVIERANVFDARRGGSQSMTFGGGAHHCPAETIAIETVATAAAITRARGLFDAYFGNVRGFVASPNARIPIFAVAHSLPQHLNMES